MTRSSPQKELNRICAPVPRWARARGKGVRQRASPGRRLVPSCRAVALPTSRHAQPPEGDQPLTAASRGCPWPGQGQHRVLWPRGAASTLTPPPHPCPPWGSLGLLRAEGLARQDDQEQGPPPPRAEGWFGGDQVPNRPQDSSPPRALERWVGSAQASLVPDPLCVTACHSGSSQPVTHTVASCGYGAGTPGCSSGSSHPKASWGGRKAGEASRAEPGAPPEPRPHCCEGPSAAGLAARSLNLTQAQGQALFLCAELRLVLLAGERARLETLSPSATRPALRLQPCLAPLHSSA